MEEAGNRYLKNIPCIAGVSSSYYWKKKWAKIHTHSPITQQVDTDKNQETAIFLLQSVNRPGIESLIDYLCDSNYFNAPASTRFHNSFSGLCLYSFNENSPGSNFRRSGYGRFKEEVIKFFFFYCVLNREWILIWWIICYPPKENIKFCRVLSRFAFQKKHSRESRYVLFFCRVLFRFCFVMVVRKCIFIYCIKC